MSDQEHIKANRAWRVHALLRDHSPPPSRADVQGVLDDAKAERDVLLAACERVIEAIDNPDHEVGCTSCYAPAVRAAIKKARGE